MKASVFELSILVFLINQRCVDSINFVVPPEKFIEHRAKMSLDCHKKYRSFKGDDGKKYCRFFYSFAGLCWPPIEVNTNVTLECDQVFFSGQITRNCFLNENASDDTIYTGRWQMFSERQYHQRCIRRPIEVVKKYFENYALENKLTTRKILDASNELREHYMRITEMQYCMFYIGITLCTISLCVLAWLYPWTDIRINIHRHVIFAFLCNYVIIVAYHLYLDSSRSQNQPREVRYRTANVMYTVYLYCYLVNHAWIFNEGVIQFTMVYFVFAPKTKYKYYALFAYTFPILPLVVYIICATKLDPPEEVYWHGADYSWENIVSGSGYVLVGLNLFIMSYLIYIIVKKLRTARSPKHTKALATARSFTMLVFLLGIINLFGINWREPADLQEKVKMIWVYYASRFLLNSQGSLVCLFYVFLSPGAWKQLAKKFRQRKGRQFSRRKSSDEPGKTNRNLIESRLPRRLPCTTNSSVSTRASIESEDSQKEICKDLHQEKREAPVTLIGMVVNKTNM